MADASLPNPAPEPRQFTLRTLLIGMVVAGVLCGAFVNGFQDLLVLAIIVGLAAMLITPGEFDPPPDPAARYEPLVRIGQGLGIGAILVAIPADVACRTPVPINNVWILGMGVVIGVGTSLRRSRPSDVLCDSLWKSGVAILIGYAALVTVMLHEALTLMRPVMQAQMRWNFEAVVAKSPTSYWKTGIPYELSVYAVFLGVAACIIARRALWQAWGIVWVSFMLFVYFFFWHAYLSTD